MPREVCVRAEQRTARAGAGAAWERILHCSTGKGVTTEFFVDRLLTELSILTHPYHIYTTAEPSLLLARRAFVVLSSLFITSKYPTFICCEFLLFALLLRRSSRGHRAVRGAFGVIFDTSAFLRVHVRGVHGVACVLAYSLLFLRQLQYLYFCKIMLLSLCFTPVCARGLVARDFDSTRTAAA
jgi:hypothetical protein